MACHRFHGNRHPVTPDLRMVWTSGHPLAAGLYPFQILTANGQPEPGLPLK